MTDEFLFESCTFRGSHDGPRMLVTAGIHGDEFLPMLAVSELIRRFATDDPLRDQIRGSITLIPITNQSAYQSGDRVGEDGKDLARTFPGQPGGSLTERVAHALTQEIAGADFYIDLHTGGTELCVLPLSGYMLHDDPDILDQQRAMATAFQLPMAWGTSAKLEGRSLSVARDAGVPAIYVEYLGAHRELLETSQCWQRSIISKHPLVAGCLNVMQHLKLIDHPQKRSAKQEVIEDWRDGSGHMQVANPAPASGFLKPRVDLGQQVSRGSLLAEIESVTNQQKHLVVSSQTGKVVVLREYPRINEGDSVAVIAERCEAS